MQIDMTVQQAEFAYSAIILRAADLDKMPHAQGVAMLRRELWKVARKLARATGETDAADYCDMMAHEANRQC